MNAAMVTADAESSVGLARAFWVTSPGHGAIREVQLPQRGEHDVLVRTLCSGISRGTEALVFGGRVPRSEYERMRAPFQEGAFPGPVKYGYANVGVVEEGPSMLIGRPVFSLFPHQTRFIVPADAVHVLPEEVPAGRGVLAANLETAVTGVWDAAPEPGMRVVVVGAGTVGCLVAWALKAIASVTCTLTDINARRAAVAERLGVPFSTPDEVTGDAQVVIHTSGSPAGLACSLDLAAADATIVEMSWYGDQIVGLPLGGAFHSRRLTIKASQVGSIPPSMRDRWTHKSRLDFAIGLLKDEGLDALITGESDFEELPAVMARLASSPGDTLCHRIRY